jgi:predicted MFS family arabinose efflux permease
MCTGNRQGHLLLRQSRADHVPSPWGHVIALSIDQMLAWGVLYYAYSVLFLPVAMDTGVSREFVAGAFSAALLVSGLLARPVGRALDRWGARRILLLGAVVGLVALAGLFLSTGPFTLVLAFLVLGVAQALALYESAFRAVVSWLPVARTRSRALLLVTSVAGFASTVFLPLTAFLVGRWGWRPSVAVLGLLLAAVILPVRLRLPAMNLALQDLSTRVRGGRRPVPGARLLTTAFALHAFASTGVAVYLVWHLAERGASMQAAAAMAGLAGASQVPGRLLLAPLQGVFGSRLRIPLLFLVQAAALFGLVAGTDILAVAALMLFGAANGIMTLERAAITVEWFGRDSFGTRTGDIASVSLVARAAAPYAVAVLREGTGYAAAFAILAVVLVLGALIMAFAHSTWMVGRDLPAARS